MKVTVGRLIRIGLTAAIVVMLVLFARTVNWSATWASLRQASLGLLLAAAVVNLLSLVAKGVRWWVFLRPVGATSLWLAVRASFAGAGLNNVLVANGGEAARVIFVSRAAHIQSSKTLATLALERLFELVGYIVMLTLAVAILPLPAMISRFRPVAYAALVIVLGLLWWLLRHEPNIAPAPATDRRWRARAKAYLAGFFHTLSSVSTYPRFTAALALSVLIWALQVATYHMTAKAAHLPIPLVGTVAALIAVNIGFVLRATPGNVGLFQVLYALAAASFGIDRESAIAVAFLIQTQQILPVTALGIIAAPEFIFKRRKRPRPDNVLPGEPRVEG